MITAPNPGLEDKPLQNRPAYATLRDESWWKKLQLVFGTTPRVYNYTLGLDRDNHPFLTVRIGIRTTFLKEAFYPGLKIALTSIGMAILISLIAAAFVSNLALKPLEQIGFTAGCYQGRPRRRQPGNWSPAGRRMRWCRFRTRLNGWAGGCAMSRKCSRP